MSKEQEEITSKELGVLVYEEVLRKFHGRELDFGGNTPSAVAVDDGDQHDWGRNRTGIIHYDKVAVVKVGHKNLAIVLGTKMENYPVDGYSFDLKVFRVDSTNKREEELAQELSEAIRNRVGFQDSLLVGERGLGIKAAPSLNRLLGTAFEQYVVQEPKLNNKVVNYEGFGTPILEQGMRFRPEAVGIVAGAIVRVLSEVR